MKNVCNKCRSLFSVVVPAYNSAEYISKCIESVLDQTYLDFELILVDDGSRDNTLELCNAYAKKDSRIKVIHKENGGHTSARNEGLKASTGEYIVFLDSDDWLALDVLALCSSEISANSPDVIVYRIYNTGTKNYFENNVDFGYYSLGVTPNVIIDTLIMDENGSSAFVKGLIGKVFRRKIIFENQLNVSKEVRIAEDGMAFVGAVLDSSSISVIPNATYYYYVREGSVSHSSDAKAFYRLPFMFDFYQRKLKEREENASLSSQMDRYVVAQLYTASLLVLRSGGRRKELNSGLKLALNDRFIFNAFKKARFGRGGRKYLIKKLILRYRLWGLARLLDQRG